MVWKTLATPCTNFLVTTPLTIPNHMHYLQFFHCTLKGVKCSLWRTMKCYKLLVLEMMVKQDKGEFRVSKLSKVDHHTFKFPRPNSWFPRPQSLAKTTLKIGTALRLPLTLSCQGRTVYPNSWSVTWSSTTFCHPNSAVSFAGLLLPSCHSWSGVLAAPLAPCPRLLSPVHLLWCYHRGITTV